MKKHCKRTVHVAIPPKGMRPKMNGEKRMALSINHADLVREIAQGMATELTLWQWVGALMTFGHVARLSGYGEDELSALLKEGSALINRYRRTGRVAFDGPGYQAAKHGLDVMDALAVQVDEHTFKAGSYLGEDDVNRLARRLEAEKCSN